MEETILLVIDRDKQLQNFLAVWHLCCSTEDGCLNPTRARALLGETFPVTRIHDRAALLGLILNDGTIHATAKSYLQAAASEVLQGFAAVRRAAAERNRLKPEPRRGPDGQDKPSSATGGTTE